jgi:pimeloyl-ACP methyl ester carboxylesterase
MSAVDATVTAVSAATQFVEARERRLAYRSIGTGTPIVLCTRFRGNLDLWDPLFLDSLAARGLRVVTFDYSGLGLSTGDRSYDPAALARDAKDLIDALGLDSIAIGGWSLGGLAAQTFVAMYPQQVTHAVLIGTGPPGPLVKTAEQLFYDTARIPENTFEEQIILFFEPRSQVSRTAARSSVDRIELRRSDRSAPVPIEFAAAALGLRPRNPMFPADAVLAALKSTSIPILHVGGDHDISFPVENWYALNQQLPTLQLLTFPQAGHAPHHQYPVASAKYIATFLNETPSVASP